MIFHARDITLIAQQVKTQARLPVKAHQTARDPYFRILAFHDDRVHTIASRRRVMYQVGSSYTVQPSPNRKGVWWSRDDQTWQIEQADGLTPLRITILSIQRQTLHDITAVDAVAEGFCDREQFAQNWMSHYETGKFAWDRNPLVWVLAWEITP